MYGRQEVEACVTHVCLYHNHYCVYLYICASVSVCVYVYVSGRVSDACLYVSLCGCVYV
jgi:hypothetical protein